MNSTGTIEHVAPLARPESDASLSEQGLKETQKPSSWLRAKLVELYSAEFKRLKVEFERASQLASEEVEKSKSMNAALQLEQDNERKLAMGAELADQNGRCDGVNRQVQEVNKRMAALKTQFDLRLIKIVEKEAMRDMVLETLANDEARAICKSTFERLGRLLFVPSVDRVSSTVSSRNLFGNSLESIYTKNPVYEPHLGTLLAHCHDFDRYMAYSQKRFAKYLGGDNDFDAAVRQFIIGCLFRALDGLNRDSGCRILPDYKVKDDLIGYEGSADFAIQIDGQIAAFIVITDLGDGLESGQARLFAALESSKLSEICETQLAKSKFSYGIVTCGQYWELIKLNHVSGEFAISETLGPIDINYCEPGLENENVLPLCRNILGMLEEAMKKC